MKGFHQYLSIVPVRFVTALLPRNITFIISDLCAFIAFVFMRRTRKHIQNNLLLLGIVPSSKYIYRTFNMYGRFLIDFCYLEYLTIDQIRHMVHQSNTMPKNDTHNGMIFISPHLGHWEIGGAYLSFSIPQLTALALHFPGGSIIAYRERIRKRFGIHTIYLEDSESYTKVYRALKKNSAVMMLADRNYTGKSIRVPFGTGTLEFPVGPARLAHLTSAQLIAAYFVYDKRNGFQARMKAIPLSSHKDRDLAIRETTEYIAKEFHQTIMRHPSQWFQFQSPK